jgi:hypothetical protein
MLASLILPILLSAVALFLLSFLSWMIVQLHKDDWKKLANEDAYMATAASTPVGSYMFPCAMSMAEMKTEEFQKKYDAGPRGIVTILPKANMGQNLGLTFLYFLVVSFLLAYLGTIALPRGADFLAVFRFIATAGLMTFLSAIVLHAIWFKSRIVGHVIESSGRRRKKHRSQTVNHPKDSNRCLN